jgi:DNA-directed RNA polymerase specialized sigma24 family protein
VSTDLADKLSAFLDADAEARHELPVLLESRLRLRARAIAPRDFGPRGLLDDVTSRTWELLLSKPAGSYDPRRSGPMTYVSTVARTAVRDVRAANMVVLRSPRDYTDVDVNLAASTEGMSDGGLASVPDSVDLEAAMDGLGEQARIAARMIAYEDAPLSRAAKRVGLSRFALKRQLQAWAERRVV